MKKSASTIKARFEVGVLLHLSFPDESFALIWTQHVVMNIPECDCLYWEFHRVLQPGGKLAFYDVLATDQEVLSASC